MAGGAQIRYKWTQFAPKCPDWSLKSAISRPRSGQNLPLKSTITRTRFCRSFPGPSYAYLPLMVLSLRGSASSTNPIQWHPTSASRSSMLLLLRYLRSLRYEFWHSLKDFRIELFCYICVVFRKLLSPLSLIFRILPSPLSYSLSPVHPLI